MRKLVLIVFIREFVFICLLGWVYLTCPLCDDKFIFLTVNIRLILSLNRQNGTKTADLVPVSSVTFHLSLSVVRSDATRLLFDIDRILLISSLRVMVQ